MLSAHSWELIVRSHRNLSRGILEQVDTCVVRIVVLTWQPAKRPEPNAPHLNRSADDPNESKILPDCR